VRLDAMTSESSDMDRVVAGQCIHGHAAQSDCLECAMTRYLVVSMRQLFAGFVKVR